MTDVARASGAEYLRSLKLFRADHNGQHSHMVRNQGLLSRLVAAWLIVLVAACSSSDNSSADEDALLFLQDTWSAPVFAILYKYRSIEYWRTKCESHSQMFTRAVAFCESNKPKGQHGSHVCTAIVLPLNSCRSDCNCVVRRVKEQK